MEQLIEFLKEYVLFFQEMEQKQELKLQALSTGELKQVEEMILMQQVMDKQLENMETKRLRMFEEAGVPGKTFREIIEVQDGEAKEKLQEMYHTLDSAVNQVKYLNQKAMKIAESRLVERGIKPQNHQKNKGENYKMASSSGGNILQRSI